MTDVTFLAQPDHGVDLFVEGYVALRMTARIDHGNLGETKALEVGLHTGA